MTTATLEAHPTGMRCLQKLQAIEEALLANDPAMKTHLAEIHKTLIQYEELVHLLSNDQIATVMKAQQKLTDTALAAAVTKAKTSKAAGAKTAKLGLDDV